MPRSSRQGKACRQGRDADRRRQSCGRRSGRCGEEGAGPCRCHRARRDCRGRSRQARGLCRDLGAGRIDRGRSTPCPTARVGPGRAPERVSGTVSSFDAVHRPAPAHVKASICSRATWRGSGSSGCTAAPGRGSACCRRIGSIQRATLRSRWACPTCACQSLLVEADQGRVFGRGFSPPDHHDDASLGHRRRLHRRHALNAQGVPGVPGYPLSAVGDRLKAAGHDRNRAQGDLQQMRKFKALRRGGRKRGS